jgi:hypothetical protein
LGGTKTTTNSSSSTSIDPAVQQNAYTAMNQGMAGASAYHPITIANPTGFTSQQHDAFDLISNLGSVTSGYGQKAADLSDQISAFKPKDITYTGFTPAQATGDYSYTPVTSLDKGQAIVDSYYDKAKSSAPDLSVLKDWALNNSGVDISGVNFGGAGNAVAATAEAAKANRSDIRDVKAGMTPDLLAKYMAAADPSYTQPLIAAQTATLDRARQIAMQQDAAAAASAGAFGGSRQGTVEAGTNRAYLDSVNTATGDITYKTYQDMLGALQKDLDRQLTADTTNQGVDQNVVLANSGYQQQANIANANNQTSVSQSNAAIGAQAAAQAASLQAQAALAKYNMTGQMLSSWGNAANQQYGINMDAAGKQSGLVGSFLTNDTNAQNAAGASNAQSRYNADTFNANQYNNSMAQQGQLGVNAQTADAQNWQNYGNWLNQAASTQMGLGTEAQNQQITQANALFNAGEVQRQMGDATNNVAYQNQYNEMMAPYVQAMMMQGALSIPYGTSSTGTSTTQQSTNWASMLGQMMQGGAALAPLFTSDRRLKKDVAPIENPLAAVKKLNGVNYRWKADGRPDTGLLAQDVQKAVPNGAVDVGGVLRVSAPAVLGLLTEAVKALDAKIDGQAGKATRRKA